MLCVCHSHIGLMRWIPWWFEGLVLPFNIRLMITLPCSFLIWWWNTAATGNITHHNNQTIRSLCHYQKTTKSVNSSAAWSPWKCKLEKHISIRNIWVLLMHCKKINVNSLDTFCNTLLDLALSTKFPHSNHHIFLICARFFKHRLT